MTSNEPLTAVLDMLAACREQIASLNCTLQEHAATLAQLTSAGADTGEYRSGPSAPWWNLPLDGRQEPVTRLRAWVEQVYRPGYGRLAAGLGPCWAAHDLCLYGLDILSELWSALYLRPDRTPGLLSAQAEYQARILPALASQLQAETTQCGHAPVTGQRRSAP